ncbi:aldolase/citrate lyase family protein [Deinococcus yavapaiensis]|uniref:Citrate lyase beta subunit n=1 Tax=Deinococcus yavapaiensis KR-236 TaxID=694435 RepID=A0A318S691_9DEIO|nr:aldolase/citrate lyase family protein [Deinococcus yavapaiensis]PYE49999.1 citrate lyase beta subunit [Deinococcus yavapaiensis KR-236]
MTTASERPLGASLYAPATRDDLVALGTTRYPLLDSLIYCTEDAVREQDVPIALAALREALPHLASMPGPVRFIRARNLDVLEHLLTLDLRGIQGFVLPKIHGGNLSAYMSKLEDRPDLHVMLTLETREALNEHEMVRLRNVIFEHGWHQQVRCLRIGGNDLLSTIGLRRTPGRTLYEGPLQRIVSMLVAVFKPYGFALSSPVYEVFDDLATLAREVQQDLEYGLSGKTIIHPGQLETVHHGYRVTQEELAEAHAILDESAPAVFKMNGRMCEPATHAAWAHEIIERARHFGTLSTTSSEALHF